jgi:hypothetical protein
LCCPSHWRRRCWPKSPRGAEAPYTAPDDARVVKQLDHDERGGQRQRSLHCRARAHGYEPPGGRGRCTWGRRRQPLDAPRTGTARGQGRGCGTRVSERRKLIPDRRRGVSAVATLLSGLVAPGRTHVGAKIDDAEFSGHGFHKRPQDRFRPHTAQSPRPAPTRLSVRLVVPTAGMLSSVNHSTLAGSTRRGAGPPVVSERRVWSEDWRENDEQAGGSSPR